VDTAGGVVCRPGPGVTVGLAGGAPGFAGAATVGRWGGAPGVAGGPVPCPGSVAMGGGIDRGGPGAIPDGAAEGEAGA